MLRTTCDELEEEKHEDDTQEGEREGDHDGEGTIDEPEISANNPELVEARLERNTTTRLTSRMMDQQTSA